MEMTINLTQLIKLMTDTTINETISSGANEKIKKSPSRKENEKSESTSPPPGKKNDDSTNTTTGISTPTLPASPSD